MATSLTRVKGEVKANTIFDLTFDACQKCSKPNFSSRVIIIIIIIIISSSSSSSSILVIFQRSFLWLLRHTEELQ